MLRQTNSEEDKGIVYSNRVLIGNWYEESKLEEDLHYDRFHADLIQLVPATFTRSSVHIVGGLPTPTLRLPGRGIGGWVLQGNSEHSSLLSRYTYMESLVSLMQYLSQVFEDRDASFKLNHFLEQMKNGDLMLARYRKMTNNLNKPTVLTQSPGNIGFGAKICLLAPHAPSTDPPQEDRKGLLLGGRISSNDINYSQELEDGCSVVGLSNLQPCERSAFIITSADYCDREGEHLKYNQEFLLALSSSVDKKKPLYVRYDPNPIPGLCGMFPLYLSEHPVSNARWRMLPIQSPNITRFEQEGVAIKVNTDMVINHCSTNANLGVNIGVWAMGFYGKICAPVMKTCLDVYGRELPNNIWQIYIPITK